VQRNFFKPCHQVTFSLWLYLGDMATAAVRMRIDILVLHSSPPRVRELNLNILMRVHSYIRLHAEAADPGYHDGHFSFFVNLSSVGVTPCHASWYTFLQSDSCPLEEKFWLQPPSKVLLLVVKLPWSVEFVTAFDFARYRTWREFIARQPISTMEPGL